MIYKIKNNRGAALIMVLIAIVALSIIGTVILSLMVGETKQVVNQEQFIKSHYAARSGADSMAAYWIENPQKLKEFVQADPKIGNGVIGDRSFQTFISDVEYRDGFVTDFTIRSTGFKDTNANKTLDENEDDYIRPITLIVGESNIFDYAIFAYTKLTLGKTTEGTVGTNANTIYYPASVQPDPKKIDPANPPYDGNIYLGPGSLGDLHVNNLEILNGDENYVGQQPGLIKPDIVKTDFSDGYPQVPGSGINYEDLKEITNTMNIQLVSALPEIKSADPEEKEKKIKDPTVSYIQTNDRADALVDRLVLAGKSLVVSGAGDLHLLIDGDFSLSGVSGISNTGDTRLFLYYNGSQTITFNGTVDIVGGIYAPNAKILFNGGGKVDGFIICNEFDAGSSSNFSVSNADSNVSMADMNIFGIAGYVRKMWLQ
jgi:hypothetical protein